ncbi:MAG: hypothetical protein HY241_01650 [Actinobacteria bacterium]|nr:hypothetical protein [Actinomycetota bacterium]
MGDIGSDAADSGGAGRAVMLPCLRDYLAPEAPFQKLAAGLIAAVRRVTLEEIRQAARSLESDSRRGRELLFLISHTEWTVRTVEHVDVDQADSVETRVLVDIDLTRVAHDAFRSTHDEVLVPLLVLPLARLAQHDPAAWAAHPDPRPPQLLGVDIHDHADRHVAEVPVTDIRRGLSAAVAEILLDLLLHAPYGLGSTEHNQHALLAAAVNRLLRPSDPPAQHPSTGPPAASARARLIQALERQQSLMVGGPAGASPVDDQGLPPSSVLESRIVEVLRALCDLLLVVVPVPWARPRASFTIRMPSRRLTGQPVDPARRRARFGRPEQLARLTVAAMVATTHTDRIIRITLPEGVIPRRSDADLGARGRFEVATPRQFHQFRELCRAATTADRQHDPWAAVVLAHLAARRADLTAECLRHCYQSGSSDLAAEIDACGHILTDFSRRGVDEPPASRPSLDLDPQVPDFLRRRHVVDTGTPGTVEVRIPAVEEPSLRAEPVTAEIELDLVLDNPETVATARTVNLINLVLLGALTTLLWFGQATPPDELGARPDVLATLLAIFPTIQATRVPRPDTTRLLGLLSMRHHRWGMLTVIPSLLLAAFVAFKPDGLWPVGVAAGLTVVQAGIHLPLRRSPRHRRGRGEPTMRFTTAAGPQHFRFDVLRDTWCRRLTADALNLGRSVHPYLCWERDRPGALDRLLQDFQRREPTGGSRSPDDGRRATSTDGDLIGLMRAGLAGEALTFLLFRHEPADGWHRPRPDPRWDRGRQVRPVPVPVSIPLTEPPEWVLDVFVGIPAGHLTSVGEHPLRVITRAATRCRFVNLTTQFPALPPSDHHAAAPRAWLRARVGVDYRPERTLRRLRAFLAAVGRLRAEGCLVDVFEVPTVGTTEDAQNHFDIPLADAGTLRLDAAGSLVRRPLQDRELPALPVSGPGAAGTPPQRLVLPVCAAARPGVLARLVEALSAERPSLRLAGAVGGVFNGLAVLFIVCYGGESEALPPPDTFRAQLRARLGTDVIQIVDLPQLRHGTDDGGHTELLRAYLTAPDRTGLLQRFLAELWHQLERLPHRLPPPMSRDSQLVLRFAQVQVVEGGAMAGRFIVQLPGRPAGTGRWEDVNWTAVGRQLRQALVAAGARIGDAPDPVGYRSVGSEAVTVALSLVTTTTVRPV